VAPHCAVGGHRGPAGGSLASAAALCFLLASQSGLLTVAAVLASLYPAVTILLAATVLRERIHGGQALGLAFCGLCVVLVAAG
jgi:drug/metabolite transporter (DMT)-like permease